MPDGAACLRRYGTGGLRIFRLLLIHDQLEQKQVMVGGAHCPLGRGKDQVGSTHASRLCPGWVTTPSSVTLRAAGLVDCVHSPMQSHSGGLSNRASSQNGHGSQLCLVGGTSLHGGLCCSRRSLCVPPSRSMPQTLLNVCVYSAWLRPRRR